MRHLRNTLYVFTENAYLAIDGENVTVKADGKIIGRIPLHSVENIFSFSYMGASPKLMGVCGERNIGLSFFSPNGKFLARSYGFQNGNVLLRRKQYRIADDAQASLQIAKRFISGKIFNCRWVLERCLRDHGPRIDTAMVQNASQHLRESIFNINECKDSTSLRGIEGDAASVYYGVFDEMILRNEDEFRFSGRVKRPPTDKTNALLSLFYTVLASDCAAALEGAGIDSYVGFLHTDRPGRKSLSLDLMEELRSVMVDRFILTAINNKVVSPNDFLVRETGEVRIIDDCRKNLFSAWQERKKSEITHPYLKEKIPWGLVPYVQALLLAQYIRGDLDDYPAFLWK